MNLFLLSKNVNKSNSKPNSETAVRQSQKLTKLNTFQSLFTEAEPNGKPVMDNKVVLTCASDGLSYTGVPSPWPVECRTLTDVCPVPIPEALSKMDGQVGGTADPGVGGTLTFACTDNTEVLDDGSGANTYTVTCSAYETLAAPWYEVKFNALPADYPKCQAAATRKKRQIVPVQYQYINVLVDVQFLSPNTTNISDIA
jgi:hypothetical protein